MSMKSKDKLKDVSDEELMRLFINHREDGAFTQIYQRYFVSLSKYISWLIQDMGLAKDIAQDVFVKIHNSPQLYSPDKCFKVWLFTVAKNQWKNSLRSNKQRRKKIMEFSKLAIIDAPKDQPNGNQNKIVQMNNAIGQLSEIHREMIILKYSNNLTIKEISQVLACSEGTVKSRLYYAINNLKDLIIQSHEQG